MRLAVLVLFFASVANAQFTIPQRGSVAVAPTSNTFTLVNKTTVVICTLSTSCSLSLTSNGFSGSTGNNHLMTITVGNNGGSSNFLTAVSGAGTWTCPTSVQATFNGSTSGCYNLSSTSGVSTLTLTLADTTTYRLVVKEYSFTRASCSFDVGNAIVTSSVSGGVFPGISLSLTGTSEVIEQWAVNLNSNPTAISSPYGNAQFSSVFGDADSENTASGSAPNWTATSGNNNSVAAMSFK